MTFVQVVTAAILGASAPAAPANAPAASAPAANAPAANAATPTPAPATPAPERALPATPDAYIALRVPLLAPAFAGTPVARVGEDVITVSDLADMLAQSHSSHGSTSAGKKDFTAALDRLVDLRLIVAEARDMELDQRPEFKKAMDDFKATATREVIRVRATQDVAADPEQVERVYRERVREFKVGSALFEREEDAKALVDAVAGGTAFDAAAKAAVASKRAKGMDDPRGLPAAKVRPEMLAVLEKMKAGDTSAPLPVGSEYVVIHLVEVASPDSPQVRAQVEGTLAEARQQEVLRAYYDKLVKKYARTDEALLKRVDFDAKSPGIEALLKDRRVLARIAGAKPVTVGDVAAELAGKFFHGVDRAAKEKKVNRRKEDAFEAVVRRRVLDREVEVQRVVQSPEYLRRVREQERVLLFTSFLQRAVVPDISITVEDVRKHYDEHQAEFQYPAFYRLQSVGFATASDARAALAKLEAGTDFKFLRENADRQLPAAEQDVFFDGNLVSASELPDDLAKLLAGANPGDRRLYSPDIAKSYVIEVSEQVPSRAVPFDDVAESIRAKLFTEQMNRALKDWTAKLRAAREVEVYIARAAN